MSPAQFESCLSKLGALLDLIESTGLVINLTKTHMLLKAKGPGLARLLNRHTCRTKDGWFVRIHRQDGTVSMIRLVKQAVYLGIVIIYTNMLDATMTSRIKSGQNAHRRLRKWLRGNHYLTTQQKMHLWTSCVFSVLMYGIIDIGTTPKGCHRLISTITSMIREIYRDHPYRTGRSHLDFFRRNSLPRAADLFLHRLTSHADQLKSRQELLTTTDIAHNRPMSTQLNNIGHSVLPRQT